MDFWYAVIIGYALEVYYFLNFYKYIFLEDSEIKDLNENIKELWKSYGLGLLKTILLRENLYIKQRDELGFILRKTKEILGLLIFEVAYLIILPPGLILFFFNGMPGWSKWLLYILALNYLIQKKYKEKTQMVIETINSYNKNVLKRIIEKRDEWNKIFEYDESKIKKLLTSEKFMLIPGILVLYGTLYMITYIDEKMQYIKMKCKNEVTMIMLVIIVIYIFYSAKRHYDNWKYTLNKSKNIEIAIDFLKIEEKVKDMCTKLKIFDVDIQVYKKNVSNAGVIYENNKTVIYLTSELLRRGIDMLGNGTDLWNMILVTIGHELAHIHLKKEKIILKAKFVSWGVVMFLCFSVAAIIDIKLDEANIWIAIGGIIFTCMMIFVLGIISDKRYWLQIEELKADRIAASMVENGNAAFVKFWGNDNRIKNELDTSEKLDKSNRKYRSYVRRIKIEAHPPMYLRAERMNTRKSWMIWEYIEHMLVILIWRLRGLGWNGI